jgi:hypothetical protein
MLVHYSQPRHQFYRFLDGQTKKKHETILELLVKNQSGTKEGEMRSEGVRPVGARLEKDLDPLDPCSSRSQFTILACS